MRHRRRMNRTKWLILLATVLLLALASLALAQAGTPALSWWTVDGGGGVSSDGSYTLSGTIGQPEASQQAGDGYYAVSGGFWGASSPPAGNLFLPIIRGVLNRRLTLGCALCGFPDH